MIKQNSNTSSEVRKLKMPTNLLATSKLFRSTVMETISTREEAKVSHDEQLWPMSLCLPGHGKVRQFRHSTSTWIRTGLSEN